MNDIFISCEKDSFAPGELIRAQVSWNCSKTPSNIIIKLEWRTEGRGTSDKGSVFEEKILCSRQEGQSSFDIKIPDDCPPSYSGKLVSLLWEIKARADISWKKDPKTVYPIVISKLGHAYRPPES